MANTIIKIIGNQDTGKTSTIRFLYNRLSNQNVTNEVIAQLLWNNIMIGFLSHTDPGTEDIVSENLQNFIQNSCTIIIISARKKGRVSEIIDNIANQSNYQIVQIPTYIAPTFFDNIFLENLNNALSISIENLIIPINNY